MTRATMEKTVDAPRGAVALLKQDHRAVEALFKAFEGADESEQGDLAERICQMLTVHAQIEEEILYPAAQEALDEEDGELVHEANIEHGAVKDLIAKIEGSNSDDPTFKALVTVLKEFVSHHVKEEEKELFPSLKETKLDLKQLGVRLFERKSELMEEMGLEAEAPTAPKRKKAGSRSKTRSSGRASR